MQSHTSIASKVQLTTLLFLCTLALADHYKTLGVTKDATDTAIKKAYRKLALKHHPDKATNEKDRAAAEVTFATIGEAYETLKDPTTRAQYDDSLRPKAAQFGGAQRGFFEGTSGGSRFRAAPSVFDFPDSSTMWDTAGGSMFGGGQQRAAQKPVQLYPPAVLLTTAKMRALTRLARGDTVWVVHFFTKTSHGCQQLSKSLMQLHNKLQGLVSVAAVDCDAEQALCEAQRVSQFPLVKILSASPGVHQLSATDELTESALTVSCLKAIPSHVIDLRRAAHKAQFFDMCDKEATQGCVLLFTDKYDTTPLYKRLSSVFKGQLLLGIVRGAHNSELAESLGVSSFPTLQYRKSLSSPPTIYGGIVKFEQIKAFLQHRLQ